MLTPLDLHGKKFEKGFRGYDSTEVDEFFAKVARDFERLYQDNIELKEAIERATTKLEYFEQMESTMQSTLAIAQETAEDVKQSNKKQIDVLNKETEVKCQKLMTETETACHKMRAEAEEYCRKVKAEADAIYKTTTEKTEIENKEINQAVEEHCKVMVKKAEDYSQKLISESEANANLLVKEAEERTRKLLEDSIKKLKQSESVYNERMTKLETYRNNIKSLVECQLEMLRRSENEKI